MWTGLIAFSKLRATAAATMCAVDLAREVFEGFGGDCMEDLATSSDRGGMGSDPRVNFPTSIMPFGRRNFHGNAPTNLAVPKNPLDRSGLAVGPRIGHAGGVAESALLID